MTDETLMHLPTLSDSERLAVIQDVYQQVFSNTESFYGHDIGGLLSYILGAIATSKAIGLHLPLDDAEAEAAQLLVDIFEPDHVVWRFVEVVSADGLVHGHPYFALLLDDDGISPLDEDEVD